MDQIFGRQLGRSIQDDNKKYCAFFGALWLRFTESIGYLLFYPAIVAYLLEDLNQIS